MKNLNHSILARNFICPSNPIYFHMLFVFISLMLLFGILSSGCHQPGGSDMSTRENFPYFFKVQKKIDRDSYIFDLDHNGEDEFVVLGNKNFEFNAPSRIHIRDHEYALIEQVNFNGKLQRPYAIDWNEDGFNEILMPYVKNDSLFIRILNWRGKKLKDGFMLSADNFPDRNRSYPWTGQIKYLLWYDLDRDEKQELILIMSEGYARAPRGVFVYDGESLIPRWRFEVGPAINNEPCLIDLNNDGYLEIMFSSSAPGNGYQVNGSDDDHSYLFLLDYSGNLIWRRLFGSRYTAIQLEYADLNGDGNKEIIILFIDNSETVSAPRLEIINAESGNPSQSLTLAINNAGWTIMNLDRDIQQEICVLDKDGKILLLDHQLNIIKTNKLSDVDGTFYNCGDLDQDGREEILINSFNKILCLDHNLNVKATYPKRVPAITDPQALVYHDRKAKPLLALSDSLQYELVSLERNPYYLLSFYGSIAGAILMVTLLAALVFFSIHWYQKAQLRQIIFEKIAASCQLPFFVIDHRSQVSYTNTLGMIFLKANPNRLPLRLSSLPAAQQQGELGRFLIFLSEAEAIHQEKRIRLTESPDDVLLLIAEPLLELGKKKLNWLVIIKRPGQGFDFDQAQTWMAMAQRIAHDIKNPLTSILLTVQRLQMEYRDRESGHAAKYDDYTEKIVERIEALRRTSRQFMKFVNLEKINLQPTDINQLIERFLSQAIVIPKDIQLQKQLSAEIPTIHLDQEQIQTVLENLITNAINAMPDGGKLTIATSLVLNLQLNQQAAETADYILIEIMDTGVGITDEIKNKLFQPYMSHSLTGNGLGLAIVKKIVDDHAGVIEFTTETNLGTSFMIYLPVA